LFALLPLRAGTPDPAALRAIPKRLSEFVENREIDGAVTLVATRERVLHLEAMGNADPAGKNVMKVDSIFWIASMTKPITATAILMLQEQGKLSIEDPASKYIPELANLKTVDGKPVIVTLRHMLTHTSGMGEPTNAEAASAATLAELVPHFANKPVKFEPGSKWSYCQSGINSLGRIVEIVSGQPLAEFFQTRLFSPLGMKDTTFSLSKDKFARRVIPAARQADALVEAPSRFVESDESISFIRYPAANGGLFSTASDYARFARMILNDGELDGKRYLSPKSVQLMTSAQTGDLVTGFTPGNAWGLGWCVVREPQGVTAALSSGSHGHGGAYGTQAWIDKQKGVVLILMVQRSNFPNSDASTVRQAFQDAVWK
jgi:CubicO group peptidase (beta-lactamase class C family)